LPHATTQIVSGSLGVKRLTRSNTWGWALVGLGIVFSFVGIWQGELRDVFLKAALICLECMGLR
jgi:hypothetical protein